MSDDVTDVIIDFLRGIGLEVVESGVSGDTFLPGILVSHGGLVVDRDQLKYPGDLLHEAGHLAVTPQHVRHGLDGQVDFAGPMEPIEAQAMAWSYAAVKHLGLDPRIVFHPEGYLGMADSILKNFELGVYLGVQGLIDLRMTNPLSDPQPYPAMVAWLAK